MPWIILPLLDNSPVYIFPEFTVLDFYELRESISIGHWKGPSVLYSSCTVDQRSGYMESTVLLILKIELVDIHFRRAKYP